MTAYPYSKDGARLVFIVLLGFFLSQCQSNSPVPDQPVRFDPAAIPYPELSDYGFFLPGPNGTLLPNEGLLPYEPITPLFTDYAHKARYLWMPDSVQANIDEQGDIQFPEHTVLIKTFYYPADFRKPERDWDLVETRLLVKQGEGWQAYTYVWDEQGAAAPLKLVGDLREASWKDEKGQAQSLTYAVPNKNQCKSCHNRGNQLLPIGPKARNLNAPLRYPDGEMANQLDRWVEAGVLAPGDWDERFAPIAKWDEPGSGSLQDRALAYLEVNCGHCHQPEGPAHTTGLYLTTDFADHPTRLGFCKPPVAAGKGAGGYRYGIVPGQPEHSIMVHRMKSEEPDVMMPEIGRAVPHREGIELIAEWIQQLPGDCGK